MAKFNVTYTSEGPRGLLVAARDEYATIWFALRSYADKLVAEVQAMPDDKFEDIAFLYETLGALHRLMFDIRDNHSEETGEQQVVIEFLDV